jgi:hypothetical protein
MEVNKIFQIGYSKTGTVSLYRFFIQNGVSCVHYAHGNLARTIENAVKNGGPLLGEFEDYTAFFDMQAWYMQGLHEGFTHFDKLDEQYPGSKFILNIRPPEKWLKSAGAHYAYFDKNLLARMRTGFGLDNEGLLERRERHHQRVLDYFQDRPADLLVFDIEQHGGKELCAFFREWREMQPDKWGRWNTTKRKNRFGPDRGKARVRSRVNYSSRSRATGRSSRR